MKQKLEFNLFYDDEDLEDLLVQVIINYLNDKKVMGIHFE